MKKYGVASFVLSAKAEFLQEVIEQVENFRSVIGFTMPWGDWTWKIRNNFQ